MPTTQVAPLSSHEPQKVLKTIGAGHGTDRQRKEQGSLTVLSRTDRTVPDYGVYARHMTGHWPVDTDSGALAGRAALIYGSEALRMPGQRPGHATLS